jgi:hypothetical protein
MKALLGAVAVAALLTAAPASAQSFGAPAYINLGYTNFALDEIDGRDLDDVDFNLGAVTGRLGTRLGPNFGVEGELGVGVQDQEETSPIGTFTTKLNYGAAAFAVGFLPIAPTTDLFARVGVGVTDLEFEFDPSGTGPSTSESGSEAVFGLGVGAQHFFDGVNGVRADYTRYTGDDSTAKYDALGLSYVRKF